MQSQEEEDPPATPLQRGALAAAALLLKALFLYLLALGVQFGVVALQKPLCAPRARRPASARRALGAADARALRSSAYLMCWLLAAVLGAQSAHALRQRDVKMLRVSAAPFVVVAGTLAAVHAEVLPQRACVVLMGVVGVILCTLTGFVSNFMAKRRRLRLSQLLSVVAMLAPASAALASVFHVGGNALYSSGLTVSVLAAGFNVLFS
jgi:hypothetical protein